MSAFLTVGCWPSGKTRLPARRQQLAGG